MKSLFAPNEQGTLLVPPRIQAMMAGVSSVFIIHPRYRLNYEGGTHEETILEDEWRGADFFALVGAVQAKREIVATLSQAFALPPPVPTTEPE